MRSSCRVLWYQCMAEQHRVRLSDQDIDEIVAALYARLSMRKEGRRADILRLIARLEDGGRGNPEWRFSGTASFPPAATRS